MPREPTTEEVSQVLEYLRTTRGPYSLRSVKFASHATEETPCFEATVCKDGKPMFTAHNQGSGGANLYSPLKGQTMADVSAALDEMNKWLEENLPPAFIMGGKAHSETDETAIFGMVYAHQERKRWRRIAGKETVFSESLDDAKNGSFSTLKVPHTDPRVASTLSTTAPNAILWNEAILGDAIEHAPCMKQPLEY